MQKEGFLTNIIGKVKGIFNMKRRADKQLEENDIYGKEAKNQEEQLSENKISTADEIAKRQIAKRKKDVADTTHAETKLIKMQEVEVEKSENNQLFSFKQNNDDDGANKKPTSLFDNSSINNNNSTNQQQQNQQKNTSIGWEEKEKLLDNINSGVNQPLKSSGLFNNNQQQQTQTTSLFSQSNNKLEEIKQQNKPVSLFSSDANKDKDQKQGGLFSNLQTKPSQSLFGNNNNDSSSNGTGLFGNTGTTSQVGGLFSNIANQNNNSTGLFKNNNNNSNKNASNSNNNADGSKGNNNNNGDESGDDDAVQENEEVEYKGTAKLKLNENAKEIIDPMVKLVDVKVQIIKIDSNEAIKKGSVTIERLKEKEDSQCVLVYRNTMNKIQLQSQIIPNYTKYKNFQNKETNLSLNVVESKQGEGEKLINHIVKIQFENVADVTAFKQVLEKAVQPK